MTQCNAQRGLTIPEVLIALLIFSVIAAANVYALRLAVDSRDQLTAVDAELKKLQLSRALIREDLAQVVNRPVRDEFGARAPAPFRGGQITFSSRQENDEKVLFAFVRGAVINPNAQDPRSAQQFVEYYFKGGEVRRRSRFFLDETTSMEQTERVLFDDVVDARAEFSNGEIRGELQWIDAWPVGGGAAAPPFAVALVIEREGLPELRQQFWIGDLAVTQ